jgi:hypothetical protein
MVMMKEKVPPPLAMPLLGTIRAAGVSASVTRANDAIAARVAIDCCPILLRRRRRLDRGARETGRNGSDSPTREFLVLT